MFEHFHPAQTAAIDHPIGRHQFLDRRLIVAGSAESDLVEPDDQTAHSVNGHIGRNVLHHVGLPADHGESADAAELMHAGRPGNVRPIADDHVAGQHRVVGDNHVVAHVAVVGDMAVDHQQAVVADRRGVVGNQRAMDRDVLANDIVRADHYAARDVPGHGRAGEVRRGWRLHTRGCSAEGRPVLDGYAAFQDAARTDDRSRLDDAERTDLDIRRDLGRRTDDRRWVNAHGRHLMEGGNWESEVFEAAKPVKLYRSPKTRPLSRSCRR